MGEARATGMSHMRLEARGALAESFLWRMTKEQTLCLTDERGETEMESGGDEAGPFLCYLLLLTGT